MPPQSLAKNPPEPMAKTHFLCRHLLPCFYPAAESTPSPPSKKRISASLCESDDCRRKSRASDLEKYDGNKYEEAGYVSDFVPSPAPARPSKTMVIGTIFGARRGHVWFCMQESRLCPKPFLLIELSIPIKQLVKEMCSAELVRLALEYSASKGNPDFATCPLRSIPVWNLSCNGRKIGFAVKKKASVQNRLMLRTMESITVGAGVIPATQQPSEKEEITYMRANYEHVVGSADSESFHLINPDYCPGQELSIFLLRSQ